MLLKKNKILFFILGLLASYLIFNLLKNEEKEEKQYLTYRIKKKSFSVEIHTLGELEASSSASISSSLRGDIGKIIYLIEDGKTVMQNDLLVIFDATPLEEHIETLKKQAKEQENKIEMLKKLLTWETSQVEHEIKALGIEIELAEIETNKLKFSDGPLEESRLKTIKDEAKAAFEIIQMCFEQLSELEGKELLNPDELKQIDEKLRLNKAAYMEAEENYKRYTIYTYPAQLKKNETLLKRSQNKYDEMIKAGGFRIAKAKIQLEQAKQELDDILIQLQSSENQIKLSAIRAPSSGMVVLKEEYRSGQKRKPRIGDIAIKNQPILDIPNLERMFIRTKVREIDLFKIKLGTLASIYVDAYPEVTFKGEVHSIGVLAFSDFAKTGDEKYFEVVVQLDSLDLQLRPGMTARVLFHAQQLKDKLTVPLQSIFEFNQQNYCFIKKLTHYHAIPVKVGVCNDEWSEIKSGLSENDEVLLCMPSWSEIVNASDLERR